MIYCSKCGRENADDAVFCQKCGTLLEHEDETRVARRETVRDEPDAETPLLSVSPTLFFVKLGYAAAVAGAFAVAALFSVVQIVSIPVAILIGMALLLIPAFYHIRQKLVKYSLTDSTVEIDSGFISRSTQNIPLRRIQDVTVRTTVAQRLLGVGDVVIDNASEDGGKIVLKNIDSPRKLADSLLKQMRRIEGA
ncbi:MAG: PH domain-containing protein [Acidobacteriota bacterium]